MNGRLAAAALLAALSGFSCWYVVDDAPASAGTVVFQWSIDHRYDPRLCAYYGVSAVDVTLRDAFGRTAARLQPSCAVFSMDLRVWPGRYSASLTMIDRDGYARSTTAQVPAFEVPHGSFVPIEVNFPASSFYTLVPVRRAVENISAKDVEMR